MWGRPEHSGCFAASLASTHHIPVPIPLPPSHGNQKISPGITKRPLGVGGVVGGGGGLKSLLFEKHLYRRKKTTSFGVRFKFKPCHNSSYVITVILFFLPLISSCTEREITSTLKDYCEDKR